MAYLTDLDHRLLDDWQRGFPVTPEPFSAIACDLGVGVPRVIARLREMVAEGTVARVGATCRPNTVGVSTLAAIAAPEWQIDEMARIVGQEPGVNHSYLREHDWNIWFVATAPDAEMLAATLARIEARTGLPVLDLPLKRAFNVDLGFKLNGPRHGLRMGEGADTGAIQEGDRAILQALTDGLEITEEPYAELARNLGRSEADILARIRALLDARIITRLGVIVRHRALGWRSNAMVVWKLPEERVPAAGHALVNLPEVTLCYERRGTPEWDHTLFSMIHAKTRGEALAAVEKAAALPELAGASHQVLFSIRCFKQTGALLDRPRLEAAQ
ncbi:protein nirD [Thioclava marina]|jgi:DNA-binding Lrp family transcriptional regulator|uniref:siroheme decarboxylase n=1 Tax=Thioclava marina TaxID=1915077 RepID=A0ABX3MU10_9RHOB|nr:MULTISPECIES: Lrp/AsnC family transcriptional regulator [Thioclava]OOY13774.1 protein nirD [Thioclava marina]OOY29483.1 protein nirD [Thioclava sp. L04-15]TNE83573.1 MAG: Lrp/AsnC family transcriptional regulator [Paracoccaceae bacterium]